MESRVFDSEIRYSNHIFVRRGKGSPGPEEGRYICLRDARAFLGIAKPKVRVIV